MNNQEEIANAMTYYIIVYSDFFEILTGFLKCCFMNHEIMKSAL
jgi:hypothetical protein